MANSIFELFGDTTLSGRDLITSPAKSLNDLALSGNASPVGVQAKVDMINRVVPQIDYSDYSNFVFFNSALDYFNISGDRIINEYPYDGNYDDVLMFNSASDGYQNWLLENSWPRWSGALSCTQNTGLPYVTVSDTVRGDGVMPLAHYTSSFTVEFRTYIEVPPADGRSMIMMQRSKNVETYSGNTIKLTPQISDPSWQVFLYRTGNQCWLNFYLAGAMKGASAFTDPNTDDDVFSYPIPGGPGTYGFFAAWVVDTSASHISLYMSTPASGSIAKFSDSMYLANRWEYDASGIVPDKSSSYFIVGSGSRPDENEYPQGPQNFDIAELRYWNMARSQHDIFTTYNLRVYKDDPLVLYWRFAEPYPLTNLTRTTRNWVVKDYSGNRLDGRVVNGSDNIWASASQFGDAGFGMSPQDRGEPIMGVMSSDLQKYVTQVQATASLYDRNNSNIITNLVPKQFLWLEDEQNTQVLRNLLYLLGRQFDELKVYIDQMNKLFIADQSGFNTTPDALLDEALQFWGWDTKGNFLSKEAFQWLFGLNVLDRTQEDVDQQVWTNQKLDTELYQIKNEFWRRTLNNLSYIYKKKGTRESVDALFRLYGLDSSVVRLKEFGYQPNVKIRTNRINGVKSATALKFSPATGSYYVTSSQYINITDQNFTINAQIMFPPSGSTLLPPTLLTGSVLMLSSGSSNTEILYYTRPPPGQSPSYNGTLTYQTRSPGIYSAVTFPNVPVFDGRWYNMTLYRSGSNLQIDFQHLDADVVDIAFTLTGSVYGVFYLTPFKLGLAQPSGSALGIKGGEYWTRNVQVWNMSQSLTEVNDHTMNPFSMGTDTPDRLLNQKLQWNFDELIDSDNTQFYDTTLNANYGELVHNTLPGNYKWAGGSQFYGRFNYSYNFIAPPDFNWTEEKIRYLDTVNVPLEDHWAEINDAAIELNLIDALNEDISTIVSSLDNWNNMIGQPASRYRDDYQELQKLRQQYFARLSGRINFRAFADFMDFFDRSFIELVKKLIPVRVDFKGAELVVESHMLERPKVQYAFAPKDQILVPEGEILIFYDGPPPRPSITPTQVRIHPSNPVVDPYGTVWLTASVLSYDEAANGPPTYTWTISSQFGNNIVPSGSYALFLDLAGKATTDYVTVTLNNSGNPSAQATVNVDQLLRINVTPANSETQTTGAQYPFHATGIYAKTSARDITNDVTWFSAITGVATIDSTGTATTVNYGTTQIVASSGAIVGQTDFTVYPQLLSIAITPTQSSGYFPTTSSVLYQAVGYFINSTSATLNNIATWNTSNGAIVSAASGTASIHAIGTVRVTASYRGVNSNFAQLTASALPVVLTSYLISPASYTATIPQTSTTQSIQYAAVAGYSDNQYVDVTNMSTWYISSSSGATITQNGLVTVYTSGTSSVSAAFGSIPSNTASLSARVVPPFVQSISISPASYTATFTGSGQQVQYTATANYSNMTTQDITTRVTWSLSAIPLGSSVISSSGMVYLFARGTSSIHATSGAFSSNTASLLAASTAAIGVLQSITVVPANAPAYYPIQTTQQFTAIGNYSDFSTQDLTSQVTWSSNVSFMSFDTPAVPGLATIYPAAGMTVTVTPATASVFAGSQGQQVQFSATVTGDAMSSVTWSLNGPGTLTTGGLYTAPATYSLAVPHVIATSAYDTLSAGSATVDLQPITISVTPSAPSVYVGEQVQYSATVAGSGADGSSVTWSASNGTINSSGLYTAPGGYASPPTITAFSVLDVSRTGTASANLLTIPNQAPMMAVAQQNTPWASGAISADGGVTWQKFYQPRFKNTTSILTNDALSSIVGTGTGTFVAVGQVSDGAVNARVNALAVTFDAGETWNLKTGSFATGSHAVQDGTGMDLQNLRFVSTNGTSFVAAGEYTIRMGSNNFTLPCFITSNDGVNWTQYEPVYPSSTINVILSGTSIYAGTIAPYSHVELLTWAPHINKYVALVSALTGVYLTGVLSSTFGQGFFDWTLLSSDGITWSSSSHSFSSNQLISGGWRAIAAGPSSVVVVNATNNYPNTVYASFTSTDGVNWSSSGSIPLEQNGVAMQFDAGLQYVNGKFVAPSYTSSFYPYALIPEAISTDGLVWTTRSIVTDNAWTASTTSGSAIIVVGTTKYPNVPAETLDLATAISTDAGQTWVETTKSDYTIYQPPFYSSVARATQGPTGGITVSPKNATISIGENMQMYAKVNNYVLAGATWSLSGGGSIDSNGLFSASMTPGIVTIAATASYDRVTYKSASTQISVNAIQAPIAAIVGSSMSLSTDGGLTWRKKKIADTMPALNKLVAKGSSTFIAAGWNLSGSDYYNRYPVIARTFDNGTNWTFDSGSFITGSHVNQSLGRVTAYLNSIATDGNGFIACGQYRVNNYTLEANLPFFASSSDGINWTQYEPIYPSSSIGTGMLTGTNTTSSADAYLVEWVPGFNKYMAIVGGMKTQYQATPDQGLTWVLLSTNGITWTSASFNNGYPEYFQRIVPSATGAMLWSSNGTSANSYVTNDGTTFASGSSMPWWGSSGPGYVAQAGLVYINGLFVAPGPYYNHYTMSSSNGLLFTTSSYNTSYGQYVNSLLSGSSIVAFGWNETNGYSPSAHDYVVAISTDGGQTWTNHYGGPSGTMPGDDWFSNTLMARAPLAP